MAAWPPRQALGRIGTASRLGALGDPGSATYASCRSAAPGSPGTECCSLPPALLPLLERTRQGKVYDSNETSRKVIEAAVRSARRATGTSHPDPGKVIAEIGFGFWRYLSVRRLSERLWVPYLHQAFRPGTGRPAVDGPGGRLPGLRNRVAHNEPLIRRNLAARYAAILVVAGLPSTELREHIAGRSPVPGVLADRP